MNVPNPADMKLFLTAVRGVPAYKVAQVLTRHARGEISFVGCPKGRMAEAFSRRLMAHGGYESLASLTLDKLQSALGVAKQG